MTKLFALVLSLACWNASAATDDVLTGCPNFSGDYQTTRASQSGGTTTEYYSVKQQGCEVLQINEVGNPESTTHETYQIGSDTYLTSTDGKTKYKAYWFNRILFIESPFENDGYTITTITPDVHHSRDILVKVRGKFSIKDSNGTSTSQTVEASMTLNRLPE
jgi:hypothetical protein